MKRLRLGRWVGQLPHPPRNPRIHCPEQQRCLSSQQRQYARRHAWQGQRRHTDSRRKASSTVTAFQTEHEPEPPSAPLYAPSHRKALHSARLSALHARLALPSKLPLQTLARCLIDSSADPRPGYNNAPFSILGQDLLGYYTSEYLLCHYPRLPMPVLFAAQYAYVGAATLGAMRAEWGVEVAAASGPEVDAGLLQLKRMVPGNAMLHHQDRAVKSGRARIGGSGRRNEEQNYRRGMSSRIVYDDQFGDLQVGLPDSDVSPYPGAATTTAAETSADATAADGKDQTSLPGALHPTQPGALQSPTETDPTTVEAASASFIRALAGALYLHAGSSSVKQFHRGHVLSRQLQLHTLFHFTHPTRDLSRLCSREGFEPPVARLISETGRLSRTPVFVVGVYSGEEKLGEAAGASLNEGRVRAAAAALRSWYLYSPPESEVVYPSEVEGAAATSGKGDKMGKKWKPQMIDIGEVVT